MRRAVNFMGAQRSVVMPKFMSSHTMPAGAMTREQVDHVAQVVREAGGRNLEGPQIWPEYSPGYYAFFFEDPDGNKLEICCRGSVVVAD